MGAVTVSGTTVTLGLADTPGVAPTIRTGQEITVSYADPDTGDDTGGVVQDAAGNDAGDFSLAPARVTNGSTQPAVVPGKVRNLRAGPGGAEDVILIDWEPPADTGGAAITDYLVEVCVSDCAPDATANWAALPGDTVSTATEARHTGLMASDERFYRVRAVNSVGGFPVSGLRSEDVKKGQAIVALGTVDLSVAGPAQEGGRLVATVTATTAENTQPDSSLDLQVRVTSADGTAAAPGDYAAVDETVTFRRGDFGQATVDGVTRWVARKTVRIAVVDDAEAEPAETFTLRSAVTDVVGTRYVNGDAEVEAQIAASDSWRVEVTPDPAELAEGETREVTLTARVAREDGAATPSGECLAPFAVEVSLARAGTATLDTDYAVTSALAPAGAQTIDCDNGVTEVSWRVTLRAAIDLEADAGETVTFAPTVASPADRPAPAPALAASVRLVEEPAVLPNVQTLAVEEGSTASYSLVLAKQPSGTVRVRPSLSGASGISVETNEVVFTPANWNAAQEIVIRADEDANASDETATVTHSVSGADYAGARTTDVVVTAIDNDVSYGVLQARLAGGGRLSDDPAPTTHFGEPFTVKLWWGPDNISRSGANAASPWAAIATAQHPNRAIRVSGGTAKALKCPGGTEGGFCSNVQALELTPTSADTDVVLTLEPLDCSGLSPAALCGIWNGRYTGLAKRYRWTFRGISEAPEPPENLVLSRKERLTVSGSVIVRREPFVYAVFRTQPAVTHYRVEARAPGGDWAAPWAWEDVRSNRDEQALSLRMDGHGFLPVDRTWEIRARWKNRYGWGAWSQARWTDTAAPPAPDGLALSQSADGRSVRLSWTPADTVARYQYRLVRGSFPVGSWENVPGSGPGGVHRSSFTIGGLASVWEVGVRLRALDTAGRAGEAAEATVPVQAPRVLNGRIAVTSSPPARERAVRRYAAGDTIALSVTMSRPVTVVGPVPKPTVKLLVGAQEREAQLVRIDQPGWEGVGGGGRGDTLHFEYQVRAGEMDMDGVSVPANGLRLNGARLIDAGPEGESRQATFTHAGAVHFPNHQVDSVVRSVTGAERSGNHVWVHFNADLEPVADEGSFGNQFSADYDAGTTRVEDFTEARIVRGRSAQPCRRADQEPGMGAETGCATVRLTLGQARWVDVEGVPHIGPVPTYAGVFVSYTPKGWTEQQLVDNPLRRDRRHPLAKYRLRDTAGNEVAGFSGIRARNLGPGEKAPQISVVDASAHEGRGNIAFLVRVVPPVNKALTVQYSTTNGSAKAPADYRAQVNETLSIGRNVAETKIRVPIVDDGIEDSGERFTLTLSNPTNGATLGDATATGTIYNSEDAVGVTLSSEEDYHDGANSFLVQLAFSEQIEASTDAILASIETTGGEATEVRTVPGHALRRAIEVTPDGVDAVSLALVPKESCEEANAICTANGRGLAGTVRFEMPGPAARPAVGVLRAEIANGPGDNGAWDAGETVEAEIRFTEIVTVDTSAGSPTLGVTIDGARREAVYASGSGTDTLRFAWTVTGEAAGARYARLVANGIALGEATIVDGSGRAAALDFEVAPYVTGVSFAPEPSGDGFWTAGETLSVRLAFSESVTVLGGRPTVSFVDLSLPEFPFAAGYASGSGTATLTFGLEVTGGRSRAEDFGLVADSLRLAGARIVGQASGLAAELGHPGVRADEPAEEAPAVEVSSVSLATGPGENGAWDEGEAVEVEVAFSGAVTVEGPAGSPTLAVLLDGVRREAAYETGSGTDTLRFAWTATGEDAGARRARLVANGIALGEATIVDSAGRAAALDYAVAPYVTGVSFAPEPSGDGYWSKGETLAVRLSFSEAVSVLDGSPAVDVTVGSRKGAVEYASGSGTDTLVFSQTFGGGRWRAEIIALVADSLRLEGARIVGQASGLAAEPGHPGARADGAQVSPLTAAFADMPAGHGSAAFGFEVRFSEAFTGSYRALRDSAFEVQGGRVTNARRAHANAQERNRVWRITVEPDAGADAVTVTLPATSDCEAAGAICTADGRGLSAAVTAAVPRAAPSDTAGTVLTARFENVPAEHAGEAFGFEVRFSEAFAVSWLTMRDHAFEVTGGRVTGARRVDNPHHEADGMEPNRVWNISVEPDGMGEVTVELPATADCAAAGAVCTGNGEALSNAVSAAIPGPPGLSVADAQVEEGPDAALDFAVTLSRASTEVVTVDYATSDVSAVAGADYTRTTGTLTFAPGETVKTVSVLVIDDTVDDDGETLTLVLSNPSGGNAYLSDGTGTGTIRNRDPLQREWIARFGRTVGTQAVEAVTGRLGGGGQTHVTLGGRSLPLGKGSSAPAEAGGATDADLPDTGESSILTHENPGMDELSLMTHERPGGVDKASLMTLENPGTDELSLMTHESTGTGELSLMTLERTGPAGEVEKTVAEWLRSSMGEDGELVLPDLDTLMLGSSFNLSLGDRGAGPGSEKKEWSVWGRFARDSFEGTAEGLSLEGDVTTGFVGMDVESGSWLWGAALGISDGEGPYRIAEDGATAPPEDETPGMSGRMESNMTAVYPYGRYAVTDRLDLWAMGGYGEGTMIVEAAGGSPLETDLGMTLGAVGARGTLREPPPEGGIALILRADALWVRTESEALRSGSGFLSAATADTSRMRLILEGQREYRLSGGGTITPALELGVRRDGGDAETGTGIETGARIVFKRQNLAVEGAVRTLLSHEDEEYGEWGASASIRLEPGRDGRGLSFSVAPSWGTTGSAAERLWGLDDTRGLAPDGEFEAGRRIDARVGYGLPVFGGRFTGTPEFGLGLSDGVRDYRIGWRLVPVGGGFGPFASFGITMEAARKVASRGEAESRFGVVLEARF